MGVRLIVEALDHAPEDLTHRERYVLVVLAENARDETRTCWPGIEDDETFVRRSRLKSRSQRYAVLQALIAKGAVLRASRGNRGSRAAYRIAPLAGADSSQEVADSAKGPGNQDPTGGESVPETGTQSGQKGPGFDEKGSRNSGKRVPETGTPSPHSPQSPHTYDARAEPEPLIDEPATTKQPKRKTPAPDPTEFVITDHMRAWATENAPLADVDHETAQFLDHHAAKGSRFSDWKRAWHTWMRNRQKWTSERQQRQHSNVRPLRPSHTPWQPPTDQSAYEEPL